MSNSIFSPKASWALWEVPLIPGELVQLRFMQAWVDEDICGGSFQGLGAGGSFVCLFVCLC